MNLKLTGFTKCMELARGEQYRFVVDGKPVYVLWGNRSFPDALLCRHISVTDVLGRETFLTVPSSANVAVICKDPDKPVYVELDWIGKTPACAGLPVSTMKPTCSVWHTPRSVRMNDGRIISLNRTCQPNRGDSTESSILRSALNLIRCSESCRS